MTTPMDSNVASPRAAAVLLTNALRHLEVLPLEVREPVRGILSAAIETCVVSRSLLGTPVVNVLHLAQGLIDAGTAGTSGTLGRGLTP